MTKLEKVPPDVGGSKRHISADGTTVELTWFENGNVAVVHIIRDKTGVTFNIFRDEAKILRKLLPADKPD